MSLLQELQDLIDRTGSYKDRELLLKVLTQLKQTNTPTWGYYEEKKVTRR
jgi:hypothetical protein